MTIVFRPYVPRWKRAWNVLKAKPRYWINNYPEIYFITCLTIPIAILVYGNQFRKNGWINNYLTMSWDLKPYYRQFYEVRRPDDELALNWRTPDEYPAPFLIPRAGIWPRDSKHDYAWDVK